MSGKRTKALRRKFIELTGRAAVTEYIREKRSFLRRIWDRVAKKRTTETVTGSVIVYARSEFRRFKRSGKTDQQIAAERAALVLRRAQRLSEA